MLNLLRKTELRYPDWLPPTSFLREHFSQVGLGGYTFAAKWRVKIPLLLGYRSMSRDRVFGVMGNPTILIGLAAEARAKDALSFPC